MDIAECGEITLLSTRGPSELPAAHLTRSGDSLPVRLFIVGCGGCRGMGDGEEAGRVGGWEKEREV